MLINIYFLSELGRGCTTAGREYIFEQVKGLPEFKGKDIHVNLYSGTHFNKPNVLIRKLKDSTVVVVSKTDKGIYIAHGSDIGRLKTALRENKENAWETAVNLFSR